MVWQTGQRHKPDPALRLGLYVSPDPGDGAFGATLHPIALPPDPQGHRIRESQAGGATDGGRSPRSSLATDNAAPLLAASGRPFPEDGQASAPRLGHSGCAAFVASFRVSAAKLVA